MKNLTIFTFVLVTISLLFVGNMALAADPLSVIDQIKGWLDLSPTIIVGIGVVVELILRVIPTDKPKSLLLLAANILHGVSAILEKLASLLDQVLQRLN